MRSLSFSVPAALAALAAPLCAQASWSLVYPTTSPPAYSNASFTCHERLGIVLRLFGSPAAGGPAVAWSFQGNAWAPAAGQPPSAREYASFAFDAVRDEVVMFGGVGPGSAQDDTWRWNGTQWSVASPSVRPSARSRAAMGFDPRRGVVVLFSGRVPFAAPPSDTWEWDGATWVQRTLSSAPPARESGMFAFDPATGAMLLHGGSEGGLVFVDTWSYDGTTWVQRQPATPPPPRVDGRMVTDLHRQRIVLLGGHGYDPFAWEWDGYQWHARYQPAPAVRVAPGLLYDAALRRVVVHGGFFPVLTGGSVLNDTWVYRTPSPAEFVPFGSSCLGTFGNPELIAAPFTLPWLGDTMRTIVLGVPPNEPGAIFVSSFGTMPPLSLAFAGAPGCDLLVPVDVAEFRAAALQRAEWELVIPNVPALAGVVFRQQAFVFDATANPLGLVATNGATLTLGIR